MMNYLRKFTAGLLVTLLAMTLWSATSRSKDERSLPANGSSTHPDGSNQQAPSTKSQEMSAEEKLVRDVYARLMRYQSAAVDELAARGGKPGEPADYLTFQLRRIRSGSPVEIYDRPLAEFVTSGSGDALRLKPVYLSGKKGPAHAYYEVEWDSSAGSGGQPNSFVKEVPRIADFDRYTAYDVTIQFQGKQTSYRALVLYQAEKEPSARPTRVEILDAVTVDMNTVYRDESPRVRSPWEKYVKSSLYQAVARTIKETKDSGRPLIPADAPIGYLPGDDVSPNDQDAHTMAMNAVCPDLRILRDGNDVTGTTQNVIVGERINLTLETQPDGDTATDIQWTVPGNAIANYVVNGTGPTGPTISAVTPLTALTNDAVVYYWVDGVNATVTVSCSVFGTYLTKSVTFNVQKPTATITIHSGTIAVSNESDGNLWLHFGDNNGVTGVRFDQSVAMPSGFSNGSVQWTQVVASTRITATPNTGNQLVLSGSDVVDSQFSYPFVYNGGLEDSPDIRLEPDMAHWDRSESFVSYLMFRPSGTNTIWVPLRQVPWSWNASATRTGTPNVWVLDAGANKSVGPDVNSTTEPIWSGRVQDLQLH